MIVIDTNVIAGMWVPNDMDEWVYKVFRKDSDWVAPLLGRSEFRNVVSINTILFEWGIPAQGRDDI